MILSQKNKKIIFSLATFFLFMLSFSALRNGNTFFSNTSVSALQKLNRTHNVYIDALDNTDDSSLRDSLLSVNVFQPSDQDTSMSGRLIAYAHNPTQAKEDIFLLQISTPASPDDLRALAKEYQAAIPEFLNVEVDQSISLDADVSQLENQQVHNLNLEFPTFHASAVVAPVRIGLIDSGIDHLHEIFQDKKVEDGWNVIENNQIMYDDVGHGTHVAGIILSESPEADLIPYNVVQKKGGKLSYVLKALSRAIDDHVDIVNMSFGFSEKSYALEKLINKARANGIIIVAAAGNHDTSDPYYPAYYDNVIAVAGVNASYEKSTYSNFGDWIDAAADGTNVYSSLPNNLYGLKSGTSQAAAFVSGYIANLMENSEITKDFDRDTIEKSLRTHSLSLGQDTLEGVPILASSTSS